MAGFSTHFLRLPGFQSLSYTSDCQPATGSCSHKTIESRSVGFVVCFTNFVRATLSRFLGLVRGRISEKKKKSGAPPLWRDVIKILMMSSWGQLAWRVVLFSSRRNAWRLLWHACLHEVKIATHVMVLKIKCKVVETMKEKKSLQHFCVIMLCRHIKSVPSRGGNSTSPSLHQGHFMTRDVMTRGRAVCVAVKENNSFPRSENHTAA